MSVLNGDERGRNEDDTDTYFVYDLEVFIQRSAVKVNLYGTSLLYGTWLPYVTLLKTTLTMRLHTFEQNSVHNILYRYHILIK